MKNRILHDTFPGQLKCFFSYFWLRRISSSYLTQIKKRRGATDQKHFSSIRKRLAPTSSFSFGITAPILGREILDRNPGRDTRRSTRIFGATQLTSRRKKWDQEYNYLKIPALREMRWARLDNSFILISRPLVFVWPQVLTSCLAPGD